MCLSQLEARALCFMRFFLLPPERRSIKAQPAKPSRPKGSVSSPTSAFKRLQTLSHPSVYLNRIFSPCSPSSRVLSCLSTVYLVFSISLHPFYGFPRDFPSTFCGEIRRFRASTYFKSIQKPCTGKPHFNSPYQLGQSPSSTKVLCRPIYTLCV